MLLLADHYTHCSGQQLALVQNICWWSGGLPWRLVKVLGWWWCAESGNGNGACRKGIGGASFDCLGDQCQQNVARRQIEQCLVVLLFLIEGKMIHALQET